MDQKTLIDKCVNLCGSEVKLARALHVSNGNVNDWRHERRDVPAKHLVAMAKMIPGDTRAIVAEVYLARLGKLALISLAGAVAIMSTCAATDANARCAGLKPTGDNV